MLEGEVRLLIKYTVVGLEASPRSASAYYSPNNGQNATPDVLTIPLQLGISSSAKQTHMSSALFPSRNPSMQLIATMKRIGPNTLEYNMIFAEVITHYHRDGFAVFESLV